MSPRGIHSADQRGSVSDDLPAMSGPGVEDGAVVTLRWLVGIAAIVSPLAYFASDVLETVQVDFSRERLLLTYVGEAAIPLIVLGLYALQRPHIGRAGLLGAVLYAYAYVFLASTVVFALVGGARNWAGVSSTFGNWLILHGGLMLIGGLAFGWAVVRADVFPRWTGLALALSAVLVVAVAGMPNLERTVANAVQDAAFIGMGVAVLAMRPHRSQKAVLAGTRPGDVRPA